MAKRRTKSRGNRRTKTKARQGRKDDGSNPDRSSRDRAQANRQSDAPHHHTKHRSSDASRTSGKQDNKSDSSSSDDGVHVGRWLCCYLPLFFVAFTSIGQIVLEDIVAPDEEMLRSLLNADQISDLPASPASVLLAENLTKKHPVVIIPGIVSTGLEMWKGKRCAPRFRERLWGESIMFRKLLLNPKCWLEHLALNATTGMDPDGIKVRAASGYHAADYIMGGYSLWGPLIENLAHLGYDHNSMRMAPYDWRLGFPYLEQRDHYFLRLQHSIELLSKMNDGHPAVVVAHSMGANVFLYFLGWIRSPDGLGEEQGEEWIDNHVHAFVNIAGPLLGTAKAMASVLSGEMLDTAELNQAMQLLKEQFISREQLVELFRSFGSMASLLPVGGTAVWGNSTWSPEVKVGAPFITLHEQLKTPEMPLYKAATGFMGDSQASAGDGGDGTKDNTDGSDNTKPDDEPPTEFVHKLDVNDVFDGLRRLAPDYVERVQAMYDWSFHGDGASVTGPGPSRLWTNPLRSPLPRSKRMKVFCLYGVGKPTERAYHFASPVPENEVRDHNESTSSESRVEHLADLLTPQTVIANQLSDPDTSLHAGVQLGDGDGTVPLVSLGYMCVEGWKDKSLNPSGNDVVTREYPHLVTSGTGSGVGHKIAEAMGHDGKHPSVRDIEAPSNSTVRVEAAAASLAGGGDSEGYAPTPTGANYNGLVQWMEASGLAKLGATLGTVATNVAATLLRDGVLRGGLNVLRQAGGTTADHVDILLNTELMTDVLSIATGASERVRSELHSDIRGIADRISANKREGVSVESDVTNE